MKKALEVSGKSLLSVGAALTGIFDVLDPIFSYGNFMVVILSATLVYYGILAYKYTTVEELRSSKLGGANTPALKEFFEHNWRWNTLIVLGILVTISATGYHYTNKHKADGGFIAANSPHVRSMQQALEKLLQGQEEIKSSLDDLKKQSTRLEASTNKINNNVQAIHENTKIPSLTELAKQAKKSDAPYNHLRGPIEQLHFDMIYTPEDILYITSILKERKTDLLPTLAYKFLDTCQKNSYSEDIMLKILHGLSTGRGVLNVFASKLEAVKFCLNEKPTKAMVEFFLTDENGRYSATYYEDSEAMRDLFNACSTPISLSFFSKANFLPDSIGRDLNMHNIHEIIQTNARDSVSCISDEAAILLNERYNRIELLARGYYLEDRQIYSGKCDPRVSMEEIKKAQRIGVRIRDHVIKNAIDNGCIQVN